MTDEKVQVSHLVPEDLRDEAKANSDHGDLSEAVRQAYRIVAYGEDSDDIGRLKMELEQAKQKKEQLAERHAQIADEISQVEARISTLEQRIEDAASRDSKYEQKLKHLEDTLHDGHRVFPDHAGVIEAAELDGVDPQDVIDELRERNPELPVEAFKSKADSEVAYEGPR